MLVEAWNVEHNQMHHYCLGEVADPDLVEANFESLRAMRLPKPLKQLAVFGMALIWKFYCAQQSLEHIHAAQMLPTWRCAPLPRLTLTPGAHDPFCLAL